MNTLALDIPEDLDAFLDQLSEIKFDEVSDNWWILRYKDEAAFFGGSFDIVVHKFTNWINPPKGALQ